MPGDTDSAGRLRITCLGIASTLPLYAGVASYRVLVGGAEPLATGETTLVPEALAFAGVVLALVAPLAKRVLGPIAGVITAFLLRQTTGLLGFVVTLLTGDLVWCLALCMVGLLAMVVDWPRRPTP